MTVELPMSHAAIVRFKGRVFMEPFVCLCCGTPISVRQFCYGRTCGPCDMGICQYAKGHFGDPRYFIGHQEGHGGRDIFESAPKEDEEE